MLSRDLTNNENGIPLTALYIYWDSHEQFIEKLYPIAKQAYDEFGVQAVVVTSYWQTFPKILLDEPWLKVHQLAEPEPLDPQRSLKQKMWTFLTSKFEEVRFWKSQAIDIMSEHRPSWIYMWKPYFKEIPWVIKIANETGVKTNFVGEYNVTFEFEKYKKLYRNSIIASARVDVSGSNTFLFYLVFLKAYLTNSFIAPFLESLAYKLHGIHDWKKIMATIPSITCHFVSNELFKKELIRLGASEAKIIAAGIPEQDALYRLRLAKTAQNTAIERSKFGIRSDQTVILFLLENFPALRSELSELQVNDLIKDVIEQCQHLSNVELVIKVHPRDQIANYLWIKEKYPAVRLLLQGKTVTLVSLADIVLVHGSTSISMSLAMNSPGIIVDFADYWLCKVLNRAYGIPLASNTIDLRERLKMIILEKNFVPTEDSKLVSKIIDGHAVSRILALSGFDSIGVSQGSN